MFFENKAAERCRSLLANQGIRAGGPKGYPEFRELCRATSERSVKRLLEFAEGDDPRLALDACKFIIQQGWGEAPQAVTGEGGEGPVLVGLSAVPMTADEWAAKYCRY